MLKAIFHIDESAKWKLLLQNVQNLMQAAGPSPIRIEVLANAEAVKDHQTLAPSPGLDKMRQLAGGGVVFAACNNSLRGFKIDPQQLPSFVQVVPAGVLELVQRQADGYAYIKP